MVALGVVAPEPIPLEVVAGVWRDLQLKAILLAHILALLALPRVEAVDNLVVRELLVGAAVEAVGLELPLAALAGVAVGLRC